MGRPCAAWFRTPGCVCDCCSRQGGGKSGHSSAPGWEEGARPLGAPRCCPTPAQGAFPGGEGPLRARALTDVRLRHAGAGGPGSGGAVDSSLSRRLGRVLPPACPSQGKPRSLRSKSSPSCPLGEDTPARTVLRAGLSPACPARPGSCLGNALCLFPVPYQGLAGTRVTALAGLARPRPGSPHGHPEGPLSAPAGASRSVPVPAAPTHPRRSLPASGPWTSSS